MKNVLIVGYGVVGKNLNEEINKLHPDIADTKFQTVYLRKEHDKYDLIFVCVNTPYLSEENPCDISAVRAVIKDYKRLLNAHGVIVIKSTVLPETTKKLRDEFNVPIVFSPEYYGSTINNTGFKFPFTILGGEKEDCIRVQQILQVCYIALHRFHITDSTTAELVKYMENCWLATKVSFCTQFFRIAEKHGVYYEDLRELFLLDPRVNPSHTYVFRDTPYWDSHCLNKDVVALAQTENAELLKSVVAYNQKQKL